MQVSCEQARSPHRIVAIEDNAAELQLLRYGFDELAADYTLQIFSDGAAAMLYLRQYCSEETPAPCLIILDMHMPKCDGITLLRELRANEDLARTPVAVLTTICSPSERAELLRVGVDMYRTKPIEWTDTLELAKELLSLCQRSPMSVAQSP